MAELLAAAARPGGLTVVIEDVHWADGATLDFLTFLAPGRARGAVTGGGHGPQRRDPGRTAR